MEAYRGQIVQCLFKKKKNIPQRTQHVSMLFVWCHPSVCKTQQHVSIYLAMYTKVFHLFLYT